jgi:hypothetical protein
MTNAVKKLKLEEKKVILAYAQLKLKSKKKLFWLMLN